MAAREFTTFETVTAVIHQDLPTGEAVTEPIVIGHYGPGGSGEVWVECEGKRFGIPQAHAADLIKQLRRAFKIAAEIEES